MGKGQRPVHVAVLKKSDRTMQVSLEHCASQTEAHVVLYVFVCQRGCHSEWICAAQVSIPTGCCGRCCCADGGHGFSDFHEDSPPGCIPIWRFPETGVPPNHPFSWYFPL